MTGPHRRLSGFIVLMGLAATCIPTVLFAQTAEERMRVEERLQRVKERIQSVEEARRSQLEQALARAREEMARTQLRQQTARKELQERLAAREVREQLARTELRKRLAEMELQQDRASRARTEEIQRARARAEARIREVRSWRGLALAEMNPGLARYFASDRGLLVLEVGEGSALGLIPGDVILSIGGRAVETQAQVYRILDSYAPDEAVSLAIVRKGERMDLEGVAR